MKSRIRYVWGAVLAVVALAVAGLCYLYVDWIVYTITVVNQSSHALTDVRVIMPGRVRNLGTLAPGGSDWVYTMPDTDGTLDIAFTVKGTARYKTIDYVGAGLAEHYILTVTPALTVRSTIPSEQPQ